jgi:hypothetical protein
VIRLPDDDLQGRNFQQSTQPAPEATGTAAGAAAVLGAIAAGITIRANELVALADRTGRINIDIDSTCIASLAYNYATGAMAVTFTDGSVYPYPPVSMLNFLAFINAKSKGSFFNTYVRGKWG